MHPINDIKLLNGSYDVIEHIINTEFYKTIRENLYNVRDIEKIERKIIMKNINPRDFYTLYNNISKILELSNEIKNITVLGNQRISKETIQVLGKIDVNKEYNNESINEVIKNLYSSDFFENITISIIDQTLQIIITENPMNRDGMSGVKSSIIKLKI